MKYSHQLCVIDTKLLIADNINFVNVFSNQPTIKIFNFLIAKKIGSNWNEYVKRFRFL